MFVTSTDWFFSPIPTGTTVAIISTITPITIIPTISNIILQYRHKLGVIHKLRYHNLGGGGSGPRKVWRYLWTGIFQKFRKNVKIGENEGQFENLEKFSKIKAWKLILLFIFGIGSETFFGGNGSGIFERRKSTFFRKFLSTNYDYYYFFGGWGVWVGQKSWKHG